MLLCWDLQVVPINLAPMLSDTKVIDAVTITYKEGKSLKSSTQAGRVCQYANGEALMISSYSGETRIQPNAVCAD
ncbi:hypothetical protein OFO10_01515 [Campylobacter sp. VBCF_06 NA8]|uniref:hypothetical protein n=1 Tax=Campylobacter sp. VBCF_06 NA8 TaxID=2983822 RepID=UPI0022E9AAC8|nr:hypothetical protein [Campylobacter sp. VBCF_06 NA8]MDA3045832.1 hypothetical protein [Campylobacter sp. VBCF_06 NA8]